MSRSLLPSVSPRLVAGALLLVTTALAACTPEPAASSDETAARAALIDSVAGETAKALDTLSVVATLGDSAAPVVVHEFADFQCPGCRAAALQFLPDFKARYVETGRVRFVFVPFPLTEIHPNAMSSTVAAFCAERQGKFPAYHDRLYEAQEDWGPVTDPTSRYLQYARDLRLDGASFAQCLKENPFAAGIDAARAMGMRLGLRGTPTFFVNGRPILATSGRDILALIDAALAQGAGSATRP